MKRLHLVFAALLLAGCAGDESSVRLSRGPLATAAPETSSTYSNETAAKLAELFPADESKFGVGVIELGMRLSPAVTFDECRAMLADARLPVRLVGMQIAANQFADRAAPLLFSRLNSRDFYVEKSWCATCGSSTYTEGEFACRLLISEKLLTPEQEVFLQFNLLAFDNAWPVSFYDSQLEHDLRIGRFTFDIAVLRSRFPGMSDVMIIKAVGRMQLSGPVHLNLSLFPDEEKAEEALSKGRRENLEKMSTPLARARRAFLIACAGDAELARDARLAAGSALTRDADDAAQTALKNLQPALDKISGNQKAGAKFLEESKLRAICDRASIESQVFFKVVKEPAPTWLEYSHPMFADLLANAFHVDLGELKIKNRAAHAVAGDSLLALASNLARYRQPWDTYSDAPQQLASLTNFAEQTRNLFVDTTRFGTPEPIETQEMIADRKTIALIAAETKKGIKEDPQLALKISDARREAPARWVHYPLPLPSPAGDFPAYRAELGWLLLGVDKEGNIDHKESEILDKVERIVTFEECRRMLRDPRVVVRIMAMKIMVWQFRDRAAPEILPHARAHPWVVDDGILGGGMCASYLAYSEGLFAMLMLNSKSVLSAEDQRALQFQFLLRDDLPETVAVFRQNELIDFVADEHFRFDMAALRKNFPGISDALLIKAIGRLDLASRVMSRIVVDSSDLFAKEDRKSIDEQLAEQKEILKKDPVLIRRREFLIRCAGDETLSLDARLAAGSALTRDMSDAARDRLKNLQPWFDSHATVGNTKAGEKFIREWQLRREMDEQPNITWVMDAKVGDYSWVLKQTHPMSLYLLSELYRTSSGLDDAENLAIAKAASRNILTSAEKLADYQNSWDTYSNASQKMAEFLFYNKPVSEEVRSSTANLFGSAKEDDPAAEAAQKARDDAKNLFLEQVEKQVRKYVPDLDLIMVGK